MKTLYENKESVIAILQLIGILGVVPYMIMVSMAAQV